MYELMLKCWIFKKCIFLLLKNSFIYIFDRCFFIKNWYLKLLEVVGFIYEINLNWNYLYLKLDDYVIICVR